jgi:hypothetical protein
MQSDGNLVLYRGEHLPVNAVWSSNTYGNDNALFVVQDDGNAVIYRAGSVAGTPGSALWSPNSYAGKALTVIFLPKRSPNLNPVETSSYE